MVYQKYMKYMQFVLLHATSFLLSLNGRHRLNTIDFESEQFISCFDVVALSTKVLLDKTMLFLKQNYAKDIAILFK